MEQLNKTSLEYDYALALEYSRIAALMMRTVASRAIGELNGIQVPSRYVPLKFLLDSDFLASGACSRGECRAKYAELVDDFARTMAEIYESKRHKMEESGSWTGFTELWREWLEIKVLVGRLWTALFLYDLGFPVAIRMARRAGEQVLKTCPRVPAPVIPIRSSF